MTGPPLPPPEFARRVGCLPGDDVMDHYIAIGRDLRGEIDARLPSGWSWPGKRALDFGCGAGRVLRHYLAEAEVAELHGSDLDPEMIAWLRHNLCPPLAGAAVNGPAPPLPYPDAHFDLVLATSVFTHIDEHWSGWLLELRRVLRPEGILIATFLGSGMSGPIAGEPWDPDRISMNVLTRRGGRPDVLHSEWWLREHWGRAFEIVRLDPAGFVTPDGVDGGHGSLVLRPRAGSLTRAELERERPGEPRYERARRHLEVQRAAVRREDRRALAARMRERLRLGSRRA